MNSFNKRSQLPIQYSCTSMFLFFICTQILLICHGCIDSERIALLNFKSSVTDLSDRLSTWQVGRHRNCCNWYGIQCSTDSLNIISVDLRNVELEINLQNADPLTPNTSLSGTISASLLYLTHLEYLDLGFNDLDYSKIQYQLSKFKNLLHLDVSYSLFSGSITTQFANLSSLRYLDVSSHVQDNDPTSLGYSSSPLASLESPSIDWVRELVNLRVLRLSGVDLSEASLTKNWAKPISFLADLKELHLSACSISSPLFPIQEFHNLSRLSTLKMNFNENLNSSIPLQIASLTSLSVLELAGCFNLQGSIPYLPQIKQLDVRGNEYLQVNLSEMFERQWPKLQALLISLTSVNGSIPSSISNAPVLVSLFASDCSIDGSIPTTISALSKLEYLDLSDNDVTGYVPSFGSNMKRLQYLSLSVNNLQGLMPESICELSSLQQFKLDRNKLTGPIPSCITKLQSLRVFDISDNAVEGIVSLNSWISKLNLTELNLNNNSITVEIAQQPFPSQYHMESLKLQSCNITGEIPAFFCKFTNLDTLELSGNNLIGAIPACLFKHKYLRNLDLSRNKLQGTLPHAFHFDDTQFMSINLARNFLEGALPVPSQMNMVFDLSQNQFTGEIPFEVGERLSKARYASLSSNQLSGPIPHSFCSNKALEMEISIRTLDLSNNTLSGSIPSSLGNCSSLSFLHLGINNLTGYVPNELEQTNIMHLLLHHNLLKGTFPNFIQKLERLTYLTLGDNKFEGNIPTFIGSFQDLQILSLRGNSFNGSIPKGISNLDQLQILDLSFNNISGSLEGKLGNLTKLTSRPNDTNALFSGGWSVTDLQLLIGIKGVSRYIQRLHGYSSGIDLSSNILEGNIPEQIGLLQGLSMLNLSNNNFQGKIPAKVGNMTGLESLDLSFNKLSGEIPKELVSLSYLGYLNLSYNNLSGRIPTDAHFQTLGADGSTFIGNDYLCGVPTKKHCDGDPIGPTGDNTNLNVEDEDATRDKLLLFGSVILGVAVGFWGLFLVLLCRKEKWWFVYWRIVDNVVDKLTRCT
ncbi:receptor-like protein 37 [Papaver somniferum]|uniref:receptor-like protein 37 n=1 Tax=Papaver somniferum TaxID=3469 RepID=UPI000E6F70AA|nr:receptor-like protein 37 [Papaver somniferum]